MNSTDRLGNCSGRYSNNIIIFSKDLRKIGKDKLKNLDTNFYSKNQFSEFDEISNRNIVKWGCNANLYIVYTGSHCPDQWWTHRCRWGKVEGRSRLTGDNRNLDGICRHGLDSRSSNLDGG